MKTITLGELLTDKQQTEVVRILNSSGDSMERVKRLKCYFSTFRDELEQKGVVPDYLAYATEYVTGGSPAKLGQVDYNSRN